MGSIFSVCLKLCADHCHPQSTATWPCLFKQHCLRPVVPAGSKSSPALTRGEESRKEVMRPWMQTCTCSQGASVSGTDDSQMFLPRHCDSHDHVCLWGSPPWNRGSYGLMVLFTWLRHSPPYMGLRRTFDACKSLDLQWFEWILRSDIKAPGTAQVRDLALGSDGGQKNGKTLNRLVLFRFFLHEWQDKEVW